MRATYPSLSGQSVFITGGATGIGAELVRAFTAQGAHVSFIDLDADAGTALAADCGARFEQVDVTDTTALKAAIAAVDRIDILINNAASDTRHDPLDVTYDYWRRCMAVNLDAAFFATQAVIPMMRAQGGGAIVNFSSINALLGPEGMPGYVTAKAGLLGMTKALARQYGVDHIRVNAIVPGWVVTERQLDTWLTPEAEADWSKLVAIKERILPADVASLALFLSADDSAMITGQHFIIDAGRI
jgi:D-xylose 1-dehydrogenase